ncbi:MAG: Fic/DOC family N-terminal domain-containing protein [Planctomycetota bacterium]
MIIKNFLHSRISNIMSKIASGTYLNQGGYKAFIQNALPPDFAWAQPLIRSLSDADRLIGRLSGEGRRLPNPHLLIRPFIKQEAVLSS